MARYTGPKTKKARALGEPIFGYDKAYEKRKYGPGQHGNSRRRRNKSEYGGQLKEKQKAKFTYGLLEKQFLNLFKAASRKKGITGENLLQALELRLDNTVFRLGIAPTRSAARQLVTHKHITVNGRILNIPSASMKIGDVISVREKSKAMEMIVETASLGRVSKYPWLEFDSNTLTGKYIEIPERAVIPENIKEQLIVELYSK